MIKTENPFARYLKSISDINLGRFLERQENALRSLEGIGYADNPPEGSYITAVRENLEILYAEKERYPR